MDSAKIDEAGKLLSTISIHDMITKIYAALGGGDFDKATELLNDVRNRLEPTTPDDEMRILWCEAYMAYKQNFKARAICIYKEIITLAKTFNPNNILVKYIPSAYYRLGLIYFELGKRQDALPYFKISRKMYKKLKNKDEEYIYVCLAYICVIKGDIEILIKCYNHGKAINNKWLIRLSFTHLMIMIAEHDDYTPRLIEWYRDILLIFSEDNDSYKAKVQHMQATLYWRICRLDLCDEALEILEKRTDLPPKILSGINKTGLDLQKAFATRTYNRKLSRWRMCHTCGSVKTKKEMQKCSGCRLVRYCNAECQLKAWPIHRGACNK